MTKNTAWDYVSTTVVVVGAVATACAGLGLIPGIKAEKGFFGTSYRDSSGRFVSEGRVVAEGAVHLGSQAYEAASYAGSAVIDGVSSAGSWIADSVGGLFSSSTKVL